MSLDKLPKSDLESYSDLTPWIVVCDGEGVQPFPSREEAVASAKAQANGNPGLILGLYRIDRYVTAQILPAKLFASEVTP